MRKFIIKAISLLIISYLAHAPIADANIIEARKFDQVEKVLENANANTLIVLDVGNVLLMPKDSVRLDRNRKIYKKFMNDMKRKFGKRKAEEFESTIWRDGEVIPVSFKFSKAINDAEAKGARVLVVTDRWNGSYGAVSSLENDLINKIKQLGYNFRSDWIGHDKMRLGEDKPPCQPLFTDFIIMSCGQNKGEVLKEFLQVIQYNPSHIIFIDDNPEHIKEIEGVMSDLNVRNFEGIRYSEADEKLTFGLDEKAVELQFATLAKDNKWIPEAEAKKLLQSR